MGRPSTCTPEIVEAICGAIANAETIGEASLSAACAKHGIPVTTFLTWCKDPAVSEQYARAREARGLAFGDKAGEVVQSVLDGTLDPAAARAALDGIKWIAARMAPKLLGDKVQQEISGPGGGPVEAVTRIEIVPGGHSAD